MKTVRFINKDKQMFAAAVRVKVNNYFKDKGISTKDNGGVVMKSIVMLSLYLMPFVLILLVPMNFLVMLLLTVIMGIGIAGTGMSVMHDAVHGSVSSKGWVNRLFGSSMYLLGGNVFNWKIQHNVLHHTFTNIQGYDQDIEPRSLIRLSKHSPWKKVHRFQYVYAFFLYSLMDFSRIVKDFEQLAEFSKSGYMKQENKKIVIEFGKMIVVKIVYLFIMLVLPILLTPFGFWEVFLGFTIMHLTASLIMSTIFQMAHVVEGADQPLPDNQGNIDNEWAIHQLITTANFSRNNRVLSWFIGGLNFQIEHHLFPNICHVHYRKISPIVEQTALEFGLVYNLKPNFTQALFSHIRTLKTLGRNA